MSGEWVSIKGKPALKKRRLAITFFEYTNLGETVFANTNGDGHVHDLFSASQHVRPQIHADVHILSGYTFSFVTLDPSLQCIKGNAGPCRSLTHFTGWYNKRAGLDTA